MRVNNVFVAEVCPGSAFTCPHVRILCLAGFSGHGSSLFLIQTCHNTIASATPIDVSVILETHHIPTFPCRTSPAFRMSSLRSNDDKGSAPLGSSASSNTTVSASNSSLGAPKRIPSSVDSIEQSSLREKRHWGRTKGRLGIPTMRREGDGCKSSREEPTL